MRECTLLKYKHAAWLSAHLMHKRLHVSQFLFIFTQSNMKDALSRHLALFSHIPPSLIYVTLTCFLNLLSSLYHSFTLNSKNICFALIWKVFKYNYEELVVLLLFLLYCSSEVSLVNLFDPFSYYSKM